MFSKILLENFEIFIDQISPKHLVLEGVACSTFYDLFDRPATAPAWQENWPQDGRRIRARPVILLGQRAPRNCCGRGGVVVGSRRPLLGWGLARCRGSMVALPFAFW